MNEALAVAVGLHFVGDHRGGERQAAAQRLREREYVRLDAEMLEGEIAAEAAEGGLGLVEDEQHASLLTMLVHLPPIAVRRHDHAAGAFDWLRNQRGERSGRLGVDHIEADLEASAVAFVPAMPYRAMIGVGRRKYERAWHHRPIALPAGDIIHGLRARRHAMP